MGRGAVGEDTAGIPLLLCLGGTDADPRLTLEDRRGSRVYGTEKFNLGYVESKAMRYQREILMEMLMEMLMEIWQSKSWHQRRVRYQSRNLGTHQFCNPSENERGVQLGEQGGLVLDPLWTFISSGRTRKHLQEQETPTQVGKLNFHPINYTEWITHKEVPKSIT